MTLKLLLLYYRYSCRLIESNINSIDALREALLIKSSTSQKQYTNAFPFSKEDRRLVEVRLVHSGHITPSEMTLRPHDLPDDTEADSKVANTVTVVAMGTDIDFEGVEEETKGAATAVYADVTMFPTTGILHAADGFNTPDVESERILRQL